MTTETVEHFPRQFDAGFERDLKCRERYVYSVNTFTTHTHTHAYYIFLIYKILNVKYVGAVKTYDARKFQYFLFAFYSMPQ